MKIKTANFISQNVERLHFYLNLMLDEMAFLDYIYPLPPTPPPPPSVILMWRSIFAASKQGSQATFRKNSPTALFIFLRNACFGGIDFLIHEPPFVETRLFIGNMAHRTRITVTFYFISSLNHVFSSYTKVIHFLS